MARDYYKRNRNAWDRGTDEVRSWFGDDEAERRRMLDDQRDDWETAEYEYENPYRSSSGFRHNVADREFDRDWDVHDRSDDRFEGYRSRPAPRGMFRGGWHERDEASMYGGSQAGRWGGREGLPPRRRSFGDDDRHVRQQRSESRAYGRGRHSADPYGSHYYYSDYYNDEHGADYTGHGPSGYRRSDERMTEELNDRLTWDWRVDATDISAEVTDGIAILSGQVRDRRMKRRAEDLADTVRGINDVDNQLRVGTRDRAAESTTSAQTPRQAGGEGADDSLAEDSALDSRPGSFGERRDDF